MPSDSTAALSTPTILIVGDAPESLEQLGRILAEAGYQVRKVGSGELAVAPAQTSPTDLVILDVEASGQRGYETCRQIKQHQQTQQLPIVFVSAFQDASDKVRAFSAGAVDYITKPFQAPEVLARVATHVRLNALQRRLEAQNRELERLATTDPLTGLLNRRSFTSYGLNYLAQASRYGTHFSLTLFDIDGFKGINDAYGHDVGDKVLVIVTRRIRQQLRDVDLFARWGGEEFIILSPKTTCERAAHLAERLRRCLLARPIEPAGFVTASFGIATERSGESFDDLIRCADHALLSAKEGGRNRVVTASEERLLQWAN
ncbi:GGDEF domain-containing response regulator [Thiorhodococcus minor]|uniref:diguanylate cyclase n=1 Tax=Thiorhodococcus minor TaxID=57489 RepID=A0A6M0JXK1_9GAMM|nr:diguanylate cyclase [Thiorhodococcus minor]NEV61889.1 diguanylate cyclase [Thiorhodococcus minor]